MEDSISVSREMPRSYRRGPRRTPPRAVDRYPKVINNPDGSKTVIKLIKGEAGQPDILKKITYIEEDDEDSQPSIRNSIVPEPVPVTPPKKNKKRVTFNSTPEIFLIDNRLPPMRTPAIEAVEPKTVINEPAQEKVIVIEEKKTADVTPVKVEPKPKIVEEEKIRRHVIIEEQPRDFETRAYREQRDRRRRPVTPDGRYAPQRGRHPRPRDPYYGAHRGGRPRTQGYGRDRYGGGRDRSGPPIGARGRSPYGRREPRGHNRYY